jgi:hypothetical protein
MIVSDMQSQSPGDLEHKNGTSNGGKRSGECDAEERTHPWEHTG